MMELDEKSGRQRDYNSSSDEYERANQKLTVIHSAVVEIFQ